MPNTPKTPILPGTPARSQTDWVLLKTGPLAEEEWYERNNREPMTHTRSKRGVAGKRTRPPFAGSSNSNDRNGLTGRKRGNDE